MTASSTNIGTSCPAPTAIESPRYINQINAITRDNLKYIESQNNNNLDHPNSGSPNGGNYSNDKNSDAATTSIIPPYQPQEFFSAAPVADHILGQNANNINIYNKKNTIPPGTNIERHLVSGCYEMLHFGHLNALRQAKQSGPHVHVVAGCHTNEDILQRKGGVNILTDEEKRRTLLGCKFVDEYVSDLPYDTIRPEDYDCKYCWHGDDKVVVQGTDIFAHAKNTGRYKELRRTEGISTTLMISRFLKSTSLENYRKKKMDIGLLLNPHGLHNNNAPLMELNKDSNNLRSGSGSGSGIDDDDPPSPASSNSTVTNALANQILSVQDKEEYSTFALATASRISRFFLPARSREYKRVVYLEGHFDLFHVGYLDIVTDVVKCEMQRWKMMLHDENAKNDAENQVDLSNVTESDIFLIIGILADTPKHPTLQSLHERGISMLSLRKVDDIVLDVRNRPNQDFRNALAIDSIYGIKNHPDFLDNLTNSKSSRFNYRLASKMNFAELSDATPDNMITWTEPGKCDVHVDVWLDGRKYFSTKKIVERVMKSRELLEQRNFGKREPEVAVAATRMKVDTA